MPRSAVSLLPLALGISYYTFQQIGYLVDVYRGEASPSSLLHYLLWVAFFAKAPAGPILRTNELLTQLRWFNPVTLDAGLAVSFIIFGLFKKLVLADTLAPLPPLCFRRRPMGLSRIY
jgi:alginate O-acetyltransferase complex protein AlgI